MRIRDGSSRTGAWIWRPRSAGRAWCTGDLTPECAELVGKVLDALGAKAGKEDDRTKDRRYHDALQEAVR
jgi:hypothetical protein